MTELRILSSRAAILAASDIQYAVVPTPEWGDGSGVRVRGLTSGELESYLNSLWTTKAGQKVETDDGRSRARLAVVAVVDGDSRPVFTSEDIDALNAKNAATLIRVTDKVLELSRAKPEAVAKLGEASGGTPIGASSSASPSDSAAPSPS